MAREVRSAWIDPGWLVRHPLRFGPTHHTPRRRERLQMRVEDLEERLEQLRGLGYLGSDD